MISNQEFLIKEFPRLHPKTTEYKKYWKEQYKKIIEGTWVSGKWMPGNLYFYSNFGTIELVKTGSKVRIFDRPMLRDLEWNLYLLWVEARGFSGFELDTEYTCHRGIPEGQALDYLKIWGPSVFRHDGTLKKYVPAREYLRKIHKHNLGRPIYENTAKNLMLLGPRTFGKSCSAGNIVAHEFLVDGAQEYGTGEKFTTNIIVGAGDSKFSTDLLSKTKLTLDSLPGDITINGVKYPSPISRSTSGSLRPGATLIQKYKKKVGGKWEEVGTLSTIKNRSFRDNPHAAQGNRSAVMVFEEIGMFGNLLDTYNATSDNMRDGHYKFGSGLFIGTGGAMDSGGTVDAYRMFYEPSKYDLLEFDDVWEHTGKIGYFVPSYLGLHQYKDKEGNTIEEAAKAEDSRQRKKLQDGKNSRALSSYITYHPVVPSEVFLIDKGSYFPSAELMVRLQELKKNNEYRPIKVELYYDSKASSGVNYTVDTKNKLNILDQFPTTDTNREGCVVLYELPIEDKDGKVPKDLYIIGHDPYASDSPDGDSLASIYVIKTKADPFKSGHDEIVAQFVGRPHLGRKIVNENLLKLSMLYGNAKIYFENAVGNTKEFFEKRKKLSLLCKQPQTVLNKRASYDTSPSIVYGYPMSNRQFKLEGIAYVRDWLLEERGEDSEKNKIRNLDLIPDPALLQELIQFNLSGNFDRVMGFLGCIVGLEETYNQYENKFIRSTPKVDLSFITNNKSIFKKNVTTPFSLS